MKKNIHLLFVAALLLSANTAMAGTSFVSAAINMVGHDSNGNPTGYEYYRTFTTKGSLSCTTGLTSSTEGCTKYTMYFAWIETNYTSNLRADYTQVVLKKSDTSYYNYSNWDTLYMSADYPSESRYWGNSSVSSSWRSGDYRKYALSTFYTDDNRHLILDEHNRPEVRIKYQYSSGEHYWGREFDFGISYLE
jgi:hypothetical protein